MQPINNEKILKKDTYGFWLLLIISILTGLRVVLIQLNCWPLNGDEAQYWDWSKHLAFGYYSKPPLVAWLIASTTKIFGNGMIGVRLASPICHAITTIFIYLSAKFLYNKRTGFWAGLIYLSMPGVCFSSTIISTDPPLLMFWAAAFYFFLRAMAEDTLFWWGAMGAALGLAMLSKYAAIFFLISIFLYLILTKEKRYILLKPSFYGSVAITLLLLMPNIIWNAHNHFVSIQAVKDNAALQSNLFHLNNLFYFLYAQFVIVNPILFLALLIILVRYSRLSVRDPSQKILLCFGLPILIVMTVEAFLSRAHGNWSAPAYITLVIAISAYLLQNNKLKWLYLAFAINLIVFVGFFQIDKLIQTAGVKLPKRTSALNWPLAGSIIIKEQAEHPNAMLLVDDRMLMAMVMYYSRIPLERTFKWNPSGVTLDQYDLKTNLKSHIGSNFILITYHVNPVEIRGRFARSELLTTMELPTVDGRINKIYLYYLQDFLGYT